MAQASTGQGRRPFGPVVLGLGAMVALGFAPVHAFGILAPALRRDFGVSLEAFSLGPAALFAIAAVSSIALITPLRRGSTRAWVASPLSVAALGWLVVAIAPNYPTALVGFAICGLTLAACLPVATRAVAELITAGSQRGAAVGIAQSGSQLSSVAIGLCLPGGIMLFGWRASVTVIAGLAVLVGVVAWSGYPSAAEDGEVRTSAPVAPRPTWIVPFLAFAFLMGTGITAFFVFFPVYLHDTVGLSLPRVGLIVAANAAVSFVGKIIWGRVAGRSLGLKPLLLALSLGAALPILAIAVPGLPVAAYIVLGLTVALLGSPWPTAQHSALLARFSGPRAASLGSATMTSGFLGMACGPLLYASVSSRYGSSAAWSAMAALIGSSGAVSCMVGSEESGFRTARSEGHAPIRPNEVTTQGASDV